MRSGQVGEGGSPGPMKARRRKGPLSRAGKEPQRLVGLSDGLFATVFTLLVLDLRIPEALSSSGTSAFVTWVSPHFFSYLLTFIVSGVYWLAHHRDFDHIVRYDRTLLGYNLLFLLFIGLFPFSTAAMSPVSGRAGDYAFYWALYGANMIFAGIMLALIWSYSRSHGFLDSEITARQVRQISVRHVITPGIFLVSVAVQALFPHAFLGPNLLLAIPIGLWLVDRRFREHDAPRSPRRVIADMLWRAAGLVPWLIVLGLAVWGMSRGQGTE